MFLGGWLSPFAGIAGRSSGGAGFVLAARSRSSFFVSMFLWIRATFPRYRYDQIMRLGWKVFIPVTLVWIVVVGAVMQIAPGASGQ